MPLFPYGWANPLHAPTGPYGDTPMSLDILRTITFGARTLKRIDAFANMLEAQEQERHATLDPVFMAQTRRANALARQATLEARSTSYVEDDAARRQQRERIELEAAEREQRQHSTNVVGAIACGLYERNYPSL